MTRFESPRDQRRVDRRDPARLPQREIVRARRPRRASYSGQFASRWGRTSFRATLTAAPGGLTDRNKLRYFCLSRAGARADYIYFRDDISHALLLDSIQRGLAWSVGGPFQLANHNLIGSEQFGGGGRYSVRGYEAGECTRTTACS